MKWKTNYYHIDNKTKKIFNRFKNNNKKNFKLRNNKIYLFKKNKNKMMIIHNNIHKFHSIRKVVMRDEREIRKIVMSINNKLSKKMIKIKTCKKMNSNLKFKIFSKIRQYYLMMIIKNKLLNRRFMKLNKNSINQLFHFKKLMRNKLKIIIKKIIKNKILKIINKLKMKWIKIKKK